MCVFAHIYITYQKKLPLVSSAALIFKCLSRLVVTSAVVTLAKTRCLVEISSK